jgi:hypothetical protein
VVGLTVKEICASSPKWAGCSLAQLFPVDTADGGVRGSRLVLTFPDLAIAKPARFRAEGGRWTAWRTSDLLILGIFRYYDFEQVLLSLIGLPMLAL